MRASSQALAWEFSTGSSSFLARKARALLTGFPSGSLGTSVFLNLMAVLRSVGTIAGYSIYYYFPLSSSAKSF
ncbi:hypothetical protein EKO24_020670 [Candidatus Methylobacter oryzae]|uniref:Uncharacterized protein n=1 Tax=Candidatus Methylobacter oryzae TaxID=2497749 RepID=A0ABY3C5S7_9GAMM|nr:hypothetical protein EKO24_020670 [Candidatus Methylobacter oryzae]